MKPFKNNLELVMKKYFSCCYDAFPGVGYSSIDLMLSGMSKYISPYNYI